VILVILFGVIFGRALDAMSLGSERALAMGVSVNRLEYAVYLLASFAAVAVVVEGGAIGFVGLVVPHIIRMTGVWRHRYLIPMSAFSGGALVVVADTMARSLWAPLQLPVGVMTALLGVPILIYLLNKRSDVRS
jgi:iron complex transport system permease protein